jgi:hypothetical protein
MFMSNKNDCFTEIYHRLNDWLVTLKAQQKPAINHLIMQARQLAKAAEAMSEEKIQQFIENLKYDLHDFYQLNKKQANSSVYLGLLNEALWDNLAKLTDKSQVEWAELIDDFDHDGIYKQGDLIGFGELQCEQCDEIITIMHVSKVTECLKCGASQFFRLPLKP